MAPALTAVSCRDPRHTNRRPEQGARGCRAQRHQRLRANRVDFHVEPKAARDDFLVVRALVQAALALPPPFEVFDRVREVHAGHLDAGLAERAAQQLASRADKRLPLPVFHVARLLADEHERPVCGPRAEHGLRGVFPQRATAAALRLYLIRSSGPDAFFFGFDFITPPCSRRVQ